MNAIRPRGRPKIPKTGEELIEAVFLDVAGGILQSTERPLEDLARYREEPVLYAKERLGIEYLPHQQAIAYGIAGRWDLITEEMRELAQLENPGHRKLAITSGQKTGKTLLIVATGCWFRECFAEARALITAAKGEQIRSVIWRELDRVIRLAPHPPPGKPSRDPASGFLSPDGSSEIRGFTGRSIESLAGISGLLLYFVDEASHLDQPRAEVIEGNTAGEVLEGEPDNPIVYTSQPTRAEGPFFDAFHSKRESWTRAHFDCERIAKWCAARGIRRKGVVSMRRVDEWRETYGEDSPFFQVRVKGNFLRNETGRIVTMHLIDEAEVAWIEGTDDQAIEPLVIGYDPAGVGDEGDEHGYAPVRGHRCLEILAQREKTEDAALGTLYTLLTRHRRPGEIPRVHIDAEGKIGAEMLGRLRAESERRMKSDRGNAFTVHAVRTSSKHVRERQKFERVRDEVWWTLALWYKRGAQTPRDPKLSGDVYAPVWIGMADGRIRATSKKMLREQLGRSPDRGDALGLAVWTPNAMADTVDDDAPAPSETQDTYEQSESFGDAYDQSSSFWPST